MRTSTPLVYASPPSARKPAFKRRRLNNAIDAGCQAGRALTDNSNVALTLNAPSSLCAKLSCSTCHRALSTVIRPGVAGPSTCSRCSAPMCAICARTCTSYTCPSSVPPTPALTRSPSPSTHVPTPVSFSPKRTTLGLSYVAMNCDPSVALSPPPTKRKKALIDKEDVDGDGVLDGYTDGSSAGRDHHNHRDVLSMSTHGGVGVSVRSNTDGTESIVVFGCGRVVCRACCVESVSNDGKLCVECFALV